MNKRILLPVGPAGHTAVAPIVRAVAHDAGSTVRLLRVFPVPERVVGPFGRTIAYVDQEMERLTAKGREDLESVEAELGVPVEQVVRFGDPVDEILTEAEAFGADLIAVTTDKRGRLGGVLTRDVGERVLRAAPVPVLLLRS